AGERAERSLNLVGAAVGQLDEHVAGAVQDVNVVAAAADHRVVAATAVERVVAEVADERVVAGAADEQVVVVVAGETVVEVVGGAVDVLLAGQDQVFEVVAEGEADGALHRVDAAALREGQGLGDDVAGAVDDVGVVALSAGYRVGAGA